jgi:flagellar hook-associated protein 3 FlgL
MRVTTNSFPDNLVYHLQRVSGRMTTLQEQAATGQRLIDPSDDPAAAVRVLNYQSERGQILQYYRNAQRAQDIITATTSEVRNLMSASGRANEIISLSTDLTGTEALSAYGTEVNQLLEQGLVNANANFNDEPLFGGTSGNTRPFTATRDANGNITSITYDGSATTAEFQVADGSRVSPYVSADKNLQIRDFLNNLVALRDALNTGDAATVKTQATPLQGSEDDLINMISGQGALQQRIDVEITQNSTRYSDLAEQISREADADLSQTVVQLTQTQNAYQAALMSAGKILNQSLLDYL